METRISRCNITGKTSNLEIVVGWDPGAQSYFAQVHDSAAKAPDDEEPAPVLWISGFDKPHLDPYSVITALRPYANIADPEGLRISLLRDKANNDGHSNYDLIDTIEMTGAPPPAPNGVTEDHLHLALEYLILIEPDPMAIESSEDYESVIAWHEPTIVKAKALIRLYGQAIKPKTLKKMQDVFYSFTNSPRYLRSVVACSVVRTALNEAWNGIGPWRA